MSLTCQQYRRPVLGELVWIGIVIAAPQASFLDGRRKSRGRQGPRQTMPCGGQTRRLRMEDALMQCSLGSWSGTSGVEVGGASRSWAGDAIPLAWQLAGFPLVSASFITPISNQTSHHTFFNVLTDLALQHSETLGC
jgi:hypothetical protein